MIKVVQAHDYRPDIDGLRAIAVISVVLFHAFPKALPGGFVGVDIFFVISGFLISKIIFSEVRQNAFSFFIFYERRIRRIFPALILVLETCCLFGWFFLLADEYSQLGKHVAAGSAFISNFVLWNEAGYFDSAADTKPLLHLWSLGIEEQFYILWPLLVWLAAKWRNGILCTLLVLVGLSFFLNTNGIQTNKTATFYSPQTRFWELLAGATLAWLAVYHTAQWQNISKKLGSWLGCVGIVLLLCSLSIIKAQSAFPGFLAILPVIGAALIILAGQQSWVNQHLLASRLMVWFGLISFPLYLWHWPLLSLARILNGSAPNRDTRWMLLVLSVFLAWLTYRYVERHIRYGGGHTRALVLPSLLTGFAAFGFTAYKQEGLPSRSYHQQLASYTDSIKVSPRARACFDIPYAYKKDQDWYCNLGNPENPTDIFLYGDSHALSLLPAFEKYAQERQINVLLSGTSGCPSLLGIQSMRGADNIEKNNCQLLNERIFEKIKTSGIKKVVLINRWMYYATSISRPSEFNPIARNPQQEIVNKKTSAADLAWAIQNTVQSYRNIGVEVFLLADNPQQLHEPKDIVRQGRGDETKYRKLSVSAAEHIEKQQWVNKLLAQQASIAGGINYVNLDELLCNKSQCPLVKDGRFLYSDDDHLSIEGALLVYPELARALDDNPLQPSQNTGHLPESQVLGSNTP